MSLETSDAEAAAVAKGPRVTLDQIKKSISKIFYRRASECIGEDCNGGALGRMTLCFVVMQNGYVVVGKSAPASIENFDPNLGKKFAKDDALRQLWPLMGYALCDYLAACQQQEP